MMKHFSPTHEPQNKTHNITTTTWGCDFCDATKERSLFAAPQKKTAFCLRRILLRFFCDERGVKRTIVLHHPLNEEHYSLVVNRWWCDGAFYATRFLSEETTEEEIFNNNNNNNNNNERERKAGKGIRWKTLLLWPLSVVEEKGAEVVVIRWVRRY